MTAIRGQLAPAGGQQEPGPSGPPLLAASGRTPPTLAQWRQPVPAKVWAKIAKPRRQAHERLAKSAEAAIARTRDLATQLQTQRREDEQALQAAAVRGVAPPPPLAGDVERALEESQRRELEALDLFDRSG